MNYEYGKVNLLDWSLRLCYNQVIDVKSGLHKILYSQSSQEKKIVRVPIQELNTGARVITQWKILV